MINHVQALVKPMSMTANPKIKIDPDTLIDNLALIGDLATWAEELLG